MMEATAYNCHKGVAETAVSSITLLETLPFGVEKLGRVENPSSGSHNIPGNGSENNTGSFIQNPGNSGSPKNPGNSGSLKNPGSSGSPKNPGNSGSPQNPDKSGSPKNPSNSNSPQNPDKSGSPKNPDKSGSPKNPGNSNSPQNPDKSGSPPNPDKSDSPQNPEKSDSPKNPDKSGSPPNPDKSGSPQTPDKSGNPQTPDKSGSPQTPDKSGNPQTPDKSGNPQNPDKSGNPQNPDKSGNPQNPGNNGSQCVLEPFRHQVAGQSLVFRYDASTICKSLISRELRVYQTMPDVLKPHVPQYRGVVDIALNGPQTNVDSKEDEEKDDEVEAEHRRGGAEHPLTTQRLLDKVVKHQEHDNVYHFLLLENIVSGYKRPCVLDLKLGTRQHGDDAPSHKVRHQVNKCRSTTSALLGVRLCGMKVYQASTRKYIKVDKMEGRSMRENDFRNVMRHFLSNGHRVRQELIPLLLVKLQRLKAAVADSPSFRFYSSSLLIVYDGRERQCECQPGNSLNSAPHVNNGFPQQGLEIHCEESDGRHCADSLQGLKRQTAGNVDSNVLSLRPTAENVDPNVLSADDARNESCDDGASDHDRGISRHEVPFQDSVGGSPDQRKEPQQQQQFQMSQPQDGAGTCVCQKHGQGVWVERSVPSAPNCSTRNTDVEQTPPDSRRRSVQRPASLEGNASPIWDGCSADRSLAVVEAENPSVSDNEDLAGEDPGVNSPPSSTSRHRRSPLKGSAETDSETRAGRSLREPHAELEEEPGSRETNNTIMTTTTTSVRKGGGVGAEPCECRAGLVDVRLVDFAHTTHAGLSGDAVLYEGPDEGCLLGLSTLLRTFADIYDHHHHHADQEEEP